LQLARSSQAAKKKSHFPCRGKGKNGAEQEQAIITTMYLRYALRKNGKVQQKRALLCRNEYYLLAAPQVRRKCQTTEVTRLGD
jgi:hypothetical protein